MFWKKSKKKDTETVSTNKDSKTKSVDITKKWKVKKSDRIELWAKNSINLFKWIIEVLVNKQILTSNDFKVLLERKEDGFYYKTILELLNDILDVFWTKKEKEVLESFFQLDLQYKLHLTSWLLTPSTTILDLFNTSWIGSLSQESIDNIFNANILPIQINLENKINSLTIISRTPEIPNNLLEIFKEIIDKKKIMDMEFILVNKSTYEDIFHQLDNDEYSYSL